ncbi:preprotein translocase subunit YajC [Corynebacterium genitalium ATCC 33030]|uniref:Preprotein translocase, YajC subunit n=1 Tax=Corynebacterium genitalium ATCC 33030 TaxID=585529 RepID=D7WCE8_9CORY|nr:MULTISPECIES: preprotein translocase subunit YajC [Corynebacterium]MCQ4618697.1 preprotein translocase subunit YajC [Corynebacterium pseudogenitalium]EFK53829.1 preprotein translocase, YajC subunit [Corynebacterium genitalium ATCC 33030]MCQ4620372.1 preprotein translocase subunit YajC [Corynebacterium sp. CCUG 71335]MCQ4622268.1 preprotein translocase subunit YajC [Corynebacterium sp. CCUG 70398]MCQ4627036.1 preprotein translocase subunit YajC [Corynebacterium sp. CCUG 65737]
MDLILLLLVFALFALPMIVMSRVNRKRIAEAKQLQASAKPGDRILTVSGFYGEIVGGTEQTVEVELAPGAVVTMDRAGVMKIIDDETVQPGAENAGSADGFSADDGEHPEGYVDPEQDPRP